MPELKLPQWNIDRAYNMKVDNKDRTYNLLACIHSIKEKTMSIDEALNTATKLGVITSPERYSRSTATGLKSYGLLSDTYTLTEVSVAFLQNKISFQEMILLQLMKKEYKYDDQSPVIRPFFVLFSVLLELKRMDENQCWIDCYDYQNYLTEIKKMDDIPAITKEILKSRKLGNRIPRYIINHFDIWISAFLTTGLIIETNYNAKENIYKRYTINPNELEFVSAILKEESNLKVIGEYNAKGDRSATLKEYGSLKNGLFTLLPDIVLGQKYNIYNLDTNIRQMLIMYLFEGRSFRDMDVTIFGGEFNSKGLFSNYIIKSFGFEDSTYSGVWKAYKNHMHFIEMCDKYKELGDIYNIIFKGGKECMEMRINREIGGKNKIFYGIPGCGKSYHVSKEELKDVNEKNIFRTTFYLDYTNSDFIGQLVPHMEGNNITYKPNFGPFTKALKRAYETDDMVYLIIEEINRGNAAAIFGDIFQLLDRYDHNTIKDVKGNVKIGDSEYAITNTFIEDYLHIEEGKVVIPSNLSIYATMNTSDQNVYPLDTAFKRRWEMIKINTTKSSIEKSKYANYLIPAKTISMKWSDFVLDVNDFIVKSESGFNMEDKQIGPYFITDDILIDPAMKDTIPNLDERINQFNEKVLEYLWNDVAKFEKDRWIQESKKTESPYSFDSLIELIDKYGMDEILSPFESEK